VEVLARLEAADPDALVEIQGLTPPLLKALLEAAPEVPVLPEHAWGVCLQLLGKYVGSGLGRLVKGSSNPVAVGPALDCLSDELVEQFGDGMPRIDIGRLVCEIARATPTASAEALRHAPRGIADTHVGSV
jgi:hypothetical protein